MFTCPNPSCRKALPGLARTCSFCQADLTLLVDYADQLQDALTRAKQLTRAGELGLAVWAYLEVLEVDPGNVAARRQVGQVATAVRQFDQRAPGRQWQTRLRGLGNDDHEPQPAWLRISLVLVLMAASFLLGSLWSASP
jgi:hypothetical protein